MYTNGSSWHINPVTFKLRHYPAAPAVAATPAPVPVSAPAPRKVSFTSDIYFGANTSVLNKQAKADLDELIPRLQTLKVDVIIVVGHTDNVGSATAKQKRGMKRANAVKSYLISKGVAASQVYTDSRGDTQPVAYNNSAEGRARNRRVEVEVVGFRPK